MKEIIIFTDGSSRGNPGPGGWGAVVMLPNDLSAQAGKVAELGGQDKHTTNNRMELMAAIEALRYVEARCKEDKADVLIHTDSAYVLQGATAWVYGWEKKNWITSTGDAVLNQDLWKELIGVIRRVKLSHDIIWKKVAGHVGVAGNERADVIATLFADGERTLLFTGAQADYEKLYGGFQVVTHDAEKVESRKRSKTTAYSYVSSVNGKIAIDKTWDACKARVAGKKSARYQKAISKEDEKALVEKFSK